MKAREKTENRVKSSVKRTAKKRKGIHTLLTSHLTVDRTYALVSYHN